MTAALQSLAIAGATTDFEQTRALLAPLIAAECLEQTRPQRRRITPIQQKSDSQREPVQAKLRPRAGR
jgi:hypothetical protein